MLVIRYGGLVSILLFSVANFISISELLHGSDLEGLFQIHKHARTHRSWLQILSRRKSLKTSTNSISPIHPDRHRTFEGTSTTAVESSMIPVDENLAVPLFFYFRRQNIECLCSDPSPDAGTVGRACSTTCTTSETLCGQTCVRSTTYTAIFSLFSGVQLQWDNEVSISVVVTSKYSQVAEKDCEKLESECIASSALVEASQLARAAVALSAGIAFGAIAIGSAATSQKQKHYNNESETEEVELEKRNIIKRSPLFESALKSSIEEQLEVPLFLSVKRQNRECTCKVNTPLWGQQECSTTCLSSKQICGHFCVQTSIFQAVVHLVSSTNIVTTRTFLTIDRSDCDKLEVDCIGSSAIVAAAKSGAVSAIVTGALSAAIAAGAAALALAPTPVKTGEHQNETEEYHQAQNIPAYENLISNNKNKIYRRKRRRSLKYHNAGYFESLVSKLKSWLIVLGGSMLNNKSNLNNRSNAKAGLNEQETLNYIGMSTVLESSIIPSIGDILDKHKFLNFERQSSLSLCSCVDPNPSLTLESAYYGRICSTTCTTTKTLCKGQICIGTTSFTALFTLFLGYQTSDGMSNLISGTVTKKFEQIDQSSCAILERECVVSSSLDEARQSGAIAARAAVALSAGIGIGSIGLAMALAMKSKKKKVNQNSKEEFYPSPEFYRKRRVEREVKLTGDLLKNDYDLKENQTHESVSRPDELSRLFNSKLLFTPWLQLNKILWNPNNSLKHQNMTPTELNGHYYETIEIPDIESSINLKVSSNFLGFRRQDAGYTCVTDGGNCTTTCLSSEMLCGGYCTRTSILENCNQLATILPVYPPNSTSSPVDNESRDIPSFYVTNEKDCDRVETNCIASSAIATAGRSGEIATGVSGAISAGMVVIAAVVSFNNNNNNQESRDNQQSNENQQNNNQQTVNNQVPVNNLPIPVIGLDFPRDGCDDSSVRFADGNCHPILGRGPCNETNRWVTIDPLSLQGKCSPRLCTDDKRVFVGRTGLCHDVNDPDQCQGGRRLYTTAYGDSICDCPIGQYPFPNSTQDDCVSLFTQGPCPDEQVVAISQGGRLFCGPAECPSVNSSASLQQFVPTENGECYALGSQGFCTNNSQVLGYDIFKRQLQCVTSLKSSNSSSSNSRVSSSSNQMNSPRRAIKFPFQIKLNQENLLMKTRSKTQEKRRQDNRGIFQFPESSVATEINFLLQPCRPGVRQGVNHKCANPLVPDLRIGEPTRPPVSPAFTCPRNGSFLQTGGQCVNDNRATSCGPSFQFNEATGQCRPRF